MGLQMLHWLFHQLRLLWVDHTLMLLLRWEELVQKLRWKDDFVKSKVADIVVHDLLRMKYHGYHDVKEQMKPGESNLH